MNITVKDINDIANIETSIKSYINEKQDYKINNNNNKSLNKYCEYQYYNIKRHTIDTNHDWLYLWDEVDYLDKISNIEWNQK